MYDSETPSYDEAVRALRTIIGKPLEDLEEDYVDPATDPQAEFYGEGAFTQAFRQQALTIARHSLTTTNPLRCYWRGELLTLTHLAGDLLSPHSGRMHRAAHNLRAITGEDYGFDLDDDLIANLGAIEAWQHRASRGEPLSPGGWAFWGKALPEPQIQ